MEKTIEEDIRTHLELMNLRHEETQAFRDEQFMPDFVRRMDRIEKLLEELVRISSTRISPS